MPLITATQGDRGRQRREWLKERGKPSRGGGLCPHSNRRRPESAKRGMFDVRGYGRPELILLDAGRMTKR